MVHTTEEPHALVPPASTVHTTPDLQANPVSDASNSALPSELVQRTEQVDLKDSPVPVGGPENAIEPVSELSAKPSEMDRLEEAAAETPVPSRTSTPIAQAPKRLLTKFEDFMIPALMVFMLGCALAYALPGLAFGYWQIGAPLIVVLAGIVIYGINKPDSRWVVRLDLWVMLLVLGAMFYHYRQFSPGPTDVSTLAPQTQVSLMGTVTNFLDANRLVLDVTRANREKMTGNVIVYLPRNRDSQPLEVGTRLLVSGELSLPNASAIPGLFNYREYLRGQHITALLKYPSRMIAYETSNQPQYVLQRWTDAMKQTVSRTFSQALPSPQAEVLGGIVLGDKAIPVDQGTKQAFIQTGLIHVLAASGMNVGIIAMSVLWLMRRFKAPRPTQFAVAMAAVGFYSLLTGLPPSIQRAATMLEFALFLKMLNKELSPLFLLCLATALLIIIAPDNVASVGFQFSVLTTFGLMTMMPPLQDMVGYFITRRLAGLILVPLVAQLWIWPLSVAYFNQFPIHSIPLNIAALVMVTPLTIIGFVAGLASIVFSPIGAAISWLARPFLDGLLLIVQGGSKMSWAQWSLASPEPWHIAGLYLFLFVLLFLFYRVQQWSLERKVLVGLLPLALLLGGLFLENSQAQSQTRLEWLPLSADKQAVLLQPAGTREVLLIAPQHLRQFEARSLADFLKHRQLSRLNAVLLMPPVGDESAGSGSLKKAFRHTQIDTLIATQDFKQPEALTAKTIQAYPEQGARLALGKVRLEGNLNQLLIFSNHYCLLALHQPSPEYGSALEENPQPDNPAEHCGVQANFSTVGTQLAAERNLSAGQYHQWVQEGPRMTLF